MHAHNILVQFNLPIKHVVTCGTESIYNSQFQQYILQAAMTIVSTPKLCVRALLFTASRPFLVFLVIPCPSLVERFQLGLMFLRIFFVICFIVAIPFRFKTHSFSMSFVLYLFSVNHFQIPLIVLFIHILPNRARVQTRATVLHLAGYHLVQ